MFRHAAFYVVTIVFLSSHWGVSPTFAEKMRIVDLPIHEEAGDVSYMKRRGDVRYGVPKDFKTVGNFYAQQLAGQQWRKSKKDNLQRNFWVQTFSKGDATLEVRVDSRLNNSSEVRLTPKGMMWEEDDQPTPRDLPYPENATEIEYDDFLGWIDYKSPSDVKTVVDFLTDELEKRKWTKTATTHNFDHLVGMKFAFDKSTLDIDVRKTEDGSEISIRSKGLQWDGMKAEIERAKKEAERLAAEEEAKQEAKKMTEALAKRKNKPKRGIDAMPKLPNIAKVVMDGKSYELSHVIAYDVYAYGEWSTKVVATQKQVKLDNLLARLKRTGKDEDEEGMSISWPEPHLEVTIDSQDRPWRMGFVAGGTPGNGSSDELTGDALVEEGRARGTVALKEPGSFFEKVYTAEISFDVPLLTKDSVAPKRLANAPKLANSGKLRIGNKTYNLPNVVAYKMKFFDDPMTTIMLTQSPINMRNLTAALGKQAADEFFEFTPQVKLVVDADDNVASVSIWADNMSMGGNSDLVDEVVIENGRARGTARMAEPGEAFDKTYDFNLSFDVQVLGSGPAAAPSVTAGLKADSYNGIPIPEGYEGIQAEGSPFRTESTTTVAAKLANVVAFYRGELSSGRWGQWKESADAEIAGDAAALEFTGPAGGLTVRLTAKGQRTEIVLVSRDAAAAKKAGMFPGPGKSRLFIANDSTRESAISISGREYKIAAGAGARNPKTGFNWEVPPGKYTVEVKTRAGQVQSESINIKPNQTMGVIIDSTGGFKVIELY